MGGVSARVRGMEGGLWRGRGAGGGGVAGGAASEGVGAGRRLEPGGVGGVCGEARLVCSGGLDLYVQVGWGGVPRLLAFLHRRERGGRDGEGDSVYDCCGVGGGMYSWREDHFVRAPSQRPTRLQSTLVNPTQPHPDFPNLPSLACRRSALPARFAS